MRNTVRTVAGTRPGMLSHGPVSEWPEFSGRRPRSMTTTVIKTQTMEYSVVSADLRRWSPSSKNLSTLVSRLSHLRADIVAIHDAEKWNDDATASLIRRLRHRGKDVVLFSEKVSATAELIPGVLSYLSNHRPATESMGAPTGEARSVNTLVVLPGSFTPVRRLETGTAYEVLASIGLRHADSLLPAPDAHWPEVMLPDGDLELSAVLTMAGIDKPLATTFTLPATGPSDWVRFPITTPRQPIVWTGELVIYYQVVPVHAQFLVLPVGNGDTPHARLVYELTQLFDDVGLLTDRVASLMVSSGGGRVLVNGLPFADNPTSVKAEAANDISRSARQNLYDIHLDADGVSKLKSDYGKDAEQFESDLLILARFGFELFDGLFRGKGHADTLPELIRSEARARQRVPVLNVADPTMSNPDSDPPLPWSLIYDVSIQQEGPYHACESLRVFGPGGAVADIPACCPYESTHTGSTLCPFGFWGLSCVIEQPASSQKLTWNVLDDRRPPAVTMAIDPLLDGDIREAHLRRLRERLPAGTVSEAKEVSSGTELAKLLARETMDVAYLYCHGGYVQRSTHDRPSTVLRFAESRIHPSDLMAWRRDRTLWWPPHWPHRKPLVVLNGCHLVEKTTATLGNFVDAFTNRAEASGVIGTEVTVEQGMASWTMEELLHSLIVGGASVGEALREVRWRMINRGNVMGLAYTLYCVAGLRLRPPA